MNNVDDLIVVSIESPGKASTVDKNRLVPRSCGCKGLKMTMTFILVESDPDCRTHKIK